MGEFDEVTGTCKVVKTVYVYSLNKNKGIYKQVLVETFPHVTLRVAKGLVADYKGSLSTHGIDPELIDYSWHPDTVYL